MIGVLIGFLARLFFMALQIITVAMTQAIGLGAMPGTVDRGRRAAAGARHALHDVGDDAALRRRPSLRGSARPDRFLRHDPAGQRLRLPRLALVDIADQIAAAFLLALRIGSPFIIYSVIVNFAIGVTNKLTPQIPVYLHRDAVRAGRRAVPAAAHRPRLLRLFPGDVLGLAGAGLAMDRRLKKMERILTIQEKMHQLAEWKLAALDREKARAGRQSAKNWSSALNRDDRLHGVFVDAMARRLNALSREGDASGAAREAAEPPADRGRPPA